MYLTNSRRKKYFYDESFFETIDTEAKAYFLGFYVADGYTKYMNGNPMAVGIEIHQKDEEILIALRNVMGDRSPEIKRRVCGVWKTPKSKLIFHSAKMCRDLLAHGIPKDKTHDLGDITSAIPTNLMNHFVRGVFDGDGSAQHLPSRLRISFRGTLEFLQSLQCVIPEPMHFTTTQKWPTLYTTTKRAGVRLAYWMHKDATIFLSRKWLHCKSGFPL